MEISDNQWRKFQIWKTKAARDQGNRRYRGSMQQDPDSVKGYHSKAISKVHPKGERHHLVGLARMNPVFQTINTKEQLSTFIGALRKNNVALGDSWEQMIELPLELHDSNNPESIHRIENELGLDDPLRYVPENATFDDAMASIPLIAKDQQASRQRIQELQYRSNTVGDSIGGTFDGFTDAVLNTPDKQATLRNQKFRQRNLQNGKRTLPLPNKHDFGIPKIDQWANRLTNRIETGKFIFDQGKNGSHVHNGVNGAAKVVPGLQPNPETDIGKRAGDFFANEFNYISNRLTNGQLPYSGIQPIQL